jgi:hypothetical protein
MGATTKKYEVYVSFCHKLVIYDKTVDTPTDFEWKFENFENL